nr:hypothetical protein [uncultured Flavobacterium sp.]
MITKAKLKETIENFPDEFSIDELIEKLIIVDKVETGRKQIINGNTLTEEELDNEIDKWFE